MKYLKLYEELSPHYRVLDGDDYDDIVFPNHLRTAFTSNPINSIPLTYTEQEAIIDLFKSKFKVNESLDTNEWIDNEVVIGFNKIEPDVSCWINIRTVRKMPPTKKYMSGRRVDSIEHEIVISKLEDEWFLVRGVWKAKQGSEEVKCDQLSGLLQYFTDRFKL